MTSTESYASKDFFFSNSIEKKICAREINWSVVTWDVCLYDLGVLKQVLDKCVVGTSVREICELGDKLLTEETGKVFKKEKELKKGIAFPTCVSVNNCICHFSPVPSEPDLTLKEDDMVKV